MNKEEILNQLELSAKAYYNNETPLLSDEEYDELQKYAEEQGWLQRDTELNDGVVLEKETEVPHLIPMLSLAKAKTKEEIESYYNRLSKLTNKGFVIEPKLDGLALSLEYRNGELFRASTRGRGTSGEDVSYLINHKELTIFNLIHKVDSEVITEIRGELVSTKDQLYENNGEREKANLPVFKNERIASAGLLKKSKLGLGHSAKLSFVPYFAYKGTRELSLEELKNYGFSSLDYSTGKVYETLDELFKGVEYADEWRFTLPFPTDGIVIKPVEKIQPEYTAHHPNTMIAFKYPGETRESEVLDVVWGTGKTGRMTPKAVIKPVTIDGVTITSISLHNLDWIQEKNIKLGSIVSVARGNDVIPIIKSVIFNSSETKEITPPVACPYCQTKSVLNGSYLECPNENCPAKRTKVLLNIVSKNMLDIEGLNEAVISALNISTVEELLTVPLETLENLKYDSGVSLGKKRAGEIYNEIQKAKTNTKEHVWLASLNIPGVGLNTAKDLLNGLGSIENVLKASIEDLQKVNNIGLKTANDIWLCKYKLKEWINIEKLIEIPKITSETKGAFAITGKAPEGYSNRNAYVKAMEEKGWVFHSSIKADTDYLVIDNPQSNSSKVKKARSLNITLVSLLP